MSVIFISEFSPENLEISKKICERSPRSKCGLWKNNTSELSKNDFMFLMDKILPNNLFILDFNPLNEEFGDSICYFITSQTFEPEHVIIRGKSYEAWAVAKMKNNELFNINCHLILNSLKKPVESFEKDILDSFETIYTMGPDCYLKEFKDKIFEVFKEFKSDFFQFVPPYVMNFPKVDCSLFLCNENNYDIIKEKENKNKESFINIDECPEEELAVYLNISEKIIDATNNREIDLILRKNNTRSIKYEEYIKDIGFFEKNEIEEKNMKEFADTFVEILFDNFKEAKGKKIEGCELT